MAGAGTLLIELQDYLTQRGTVVEKLDAATLLVLMVDWYRLKSVAPSSSVSGVGLADALVFRYGGWSEGCATAFKFSLLRRVTESNVEGRATDRLAGITLMFEPSSREELAPFGTASSDWKTLEEFQRAIEASPAFRILANARPMAAMIETGTLR